MARNRKRHRPDHYTNDSSERPARKDPGHQRCVRCGGIGASLLKRSEKRGRRMRG